MNTTLEGEWVRQSPGVAGDYPVSVEFPRPDNSNMLYAVPILGMVLKIVMLIPFFIAETFPSIQSVYLASLGGALLALFGLGVFLGNISRENLLFSGLKTIIAGVLSILIGLLLGHV